MKDITTNLFRVKSEMRAPACGSLLVAEPFLQDRFFRHSVVSVIDYLPRKGATGVVMNHITNYKLHELLEQVDCKLQIPVFCGGPLGQDRLFFLHTLGSEIIPEAREYTRGLYVGGDFDSIIDYINTGYATDGTVRFFIGYSYWVKGQLEQEIDDNKWALAPIPPNANDIFSAYGSYYWHRAIRNLGTPFRPWSLIPCNANLN